MIETLLASLVIFIYLTLTGLLIYRLASAGHGISKTTLLIISGFGIVIHAYLLYTQLFGENGLELSFFTVFSLVTWVITTLILLSAWRLPVENLAIGVFPIAALSVILRLASDKVHHLSTALSAGLEIHIVTSIIAYSLLSLAALQAILLYVQDSHLHNKHPAGFVRALPPLQTMEQLLFRMIGTGFIILCISLATGLLYIDDLISQHKTVLSLGAWIFFAILLFGRWKFGWRGRIAIRWTLTGFAFLLLAYFGSKFVLELILLR